MELPDGCRDIIEEQNVKHDRTDRHLLIEDKVRGKNDDQRDANLLGECLYRIERVVRFPLFELCSNEGLLKLILLVALVLLTDERLDDDDRLDDVEEPVCLPVSYT